MLKSRTTVITAAAAFAVGLSWGAYAGGRAAGWWEASDEHAENLFVRDRDGLRICVAANDGAKPSTTETEEALRGLRGDASFAAMYPESGQTLADACPGGPRTFRRDRDGEYADVSVVSTHADFSLFVFVGNVDGARRGFEFVPRNSSAVVTPARR